MTLALVQSIHPRPIFATNGYRMHWGSTCQKNTERALSFSGVVANCLSALWDDGTYCGDLVLWSRVRALADEGVFEMEGDGMRMCNSSVRLASRAV